MYIVELLCARCAPWLVRARHIAAKRGGSAARGVLAVLLVCALLATTYGDAAAEAPVAQAPTATPITARATPVVVLIPPSTATMPPMVASPAATPPPSPSPALAPSPTPEAALNLEALARRDVKLPKVPVSATTGITGTTLFSLTEVPPPVPTVRLPAGTVNIALLGLDTRPGGGGSLTDVIIIASINPDAPAVTLLSIPRDTLVYIPNRRMAKVNTAFAAGPDVFKQTIKYNFGLNVDYYAAVNFAGVVNAVNILGGIEIVATCPLYQVFPKDPYYFADPATPLTVTAPHTDSFTGEVWEPGQPVPTQTISIPRPGVYRLNGLQTLAYVRARYGVSGGDVDRTRRAQRVVRALLNKIRDSSLITIARLPALLDRFSRSTKTDLTVDQILALAAQADRFDDGIIRSRYLDGVGMTGATLPVVGAVLIPDRDKITPYLRMAMNVPLNQQAGDGIPVEVWNGTRQPDFGLVAADRLRELGFSVVSIQDAGSVYSKTQVMDFTVTAKGSAIPLLQRALGIRPENIIAQPNPEGPRYRIIAGQDFDPCYQKTTPANVRYAQPPAQPPTPVPNQPEPPAPADAPTIPAATPVPEQGG